MASFSMRYGYKANTLLFECASSTLKNRVFAVFYREEFDTYDTLEWENYTTGIEDMMAEMGIVYMLVSCSAFVNYLIEKWSKVAQ